MTTAELPRYTTAQIKAVKNIQNSPLFAQIQLLQKNGLVKLVIMATKMDVINIEY
jgi:hypothetical protein|tara:strand:- start:1245 stop:1409 length:165 start_codon:yes stop_codon:yes gene_type:complete